MFYCIRRINLIFVNINFRSLNDIKQVQVSTK